MPELKKIKIWLDDVRDPDNDDDWVICRTVDEAKFWYLGHRVEELSLDHDLGIRDLQAYALALEDREVYEDEDQHAETGMDFCKWLSEQIIEGTYDAPKKVRIHSSNFAGAANMHSVFASLNKHFGYNIDLELREAVSLGW